MKLEVLRVSSESDSTSGLVFDVTNGRKFLCYSLEDEYRSEKVMHETRVPAGTYKILLRKEGGFHGRYTKNMVTSIKECYTFKMYQDFNGF